MREVATKKSGRASLRQAERLSRDELAQLSEHLLSSDHPATQAMLKTIITIVVRESQSLRSDIRSARRDLSQGIEQVLELLRNK